MILAMSWVWIWEAEICSLNIWMMSPHFSFYYLFSKFSNSFSFSLDIKDSLISPSAWFVQTFLLLISNVSLILSSFSSLFVCFLLVVPIYLFEMSWELDWNSWIFFSEKSVGIGSSFLYDWKGVNRGFPSEVWRDYLFDFFSLKVYSNSDMFSGYLSVSTFSGDYRSLMMSIYSLPGWSWVNLFPLSWRSESLIEMYLLILS